jgi:predicted nuclease of predicted toxin-antitoxin system
MAEKFIVDTQLPPRLSQFLISLGNYFIIGRENMVAIM